MLNSAPIKNPISDKEGMVSTVWVLFFNKIKGILSNKDPWQLPSVAKADLPAAASFTGYILYVTNDAGGGTVAFSDGTNWRRVQDRNIIS